MSDNLVGAHSIRTEPHVSLKPAFVRAVFRKASEILEKMGVAWFLPPDMSAIHASTSVDLSLVAHHAQNAERVQAINELGEQIAVAIAARIDEIRPASIDARRVIERYAIADVDAKASRPLLGFLRRVDRPIGTFKSYRLRQACLQKDRPVGESASRVQSIDAYTNGGWHGEDEMKRILANLSNWSPERRHEIARAREAADKSADAMASRMGNDKTLLMLRGNTAAGKTYTLKRLNKIAVDNNLPELGALSARVLAESGEPEGAFNPDTVKGFIRKHAEAGKATHAQVHEEGSMITDQLIKQYIGEGKSLVIDKRFGKSSQVGSISKVAKEKGYKIFLVDVDAPLARSCKGVLRREAGGDDPLVPFKEVKAGYHQVRSERDTVSKIADVDGYFLFSNGLLIAQRQGTGAVQIIDQQAFDEARRANEQEMSFAEEKFKSPMDAKAGGGKVAKSHVDALQRLDDNAWRTA